MIHDDTKLFNSTGVKQMGQGMQGMVNGAVSMANRVLQDPFLGELAAQYGTDQTQQSAQATMDNSRLRSGQQLDEESARRLKERGVIGQQDLDQMRRAGYVSNAAQNAGSSRDIMRNQAQTLNNMYASAGDRLNSASRDAQNSLGNIAQTAASMFR
jgi:hypothetical protein